MPTGPVRPFGRRVLDTFVAPRPLFASFAHASPWLGVLLLSTAVAVIAASTLPADFFLQQMQHPVSRMGEPVQITSSPAEIVRWGRYMAMLSAIIGHPIIVFATAGVLSLLFTVLGGGGVPFRSYLALTAHAFLVTALGALLAVLAGLALGHRVTWSLAALVPDAEGVFSAVLAALDPFRLWMIGLLALGVATLGHRRSTAAAASVLVAAYLVSAVVYGSLMNG